MKTVIAVTVASLLYVCFLTYQITHAAAPKPKPDPFPALCLNPWAAFDGLAFQFCDRIDRYYNI